MYSDFSSWPREQEQSFVVYEQHAADSQKKAFTYGIIAGIGILLLGIGIFAGVEPTHKDETKGMNMSNLTKKSKTEAPAPTPAPAAAPAPAPAPAPAADGDKK
ncbi:MAG: hypothetical protein QM831_44425 [Kofleriaceae bacterium]